MKKLYFLSMMLLLLFIGCSTSMMVFPASPGETRVHVSDFDGKTEIVMEPGHIEWGFRMGIFKSSTMPKDNFILNVEIDQALIFTSEESMALRIDGEFYTFKNLDYLTDIKTEVNEYAGTAINVSKMRYVITKDLLEKLNNSQDAMIRIYTNDGYKDAKLNNKMNTYFRNGLSKYLIKLNETNI